MFDVGEHEGTPYLVMEYVSGQTLAQSMRQGGLSTLDRVCELGQQMAEALAYAHRNGVVHRDIKPANVLLTSREVYGVERAKITDFGVAKLASSELTTTGKMVGTPTFMPPEQFTGAPIDGRTDIFSVGVILYWMTTGEQPFAGETMTSVSYKVVHTDPIPPSKLNPAIPSGLEAAILKCLAKNPAERYQTGDDLARALSALRHGAGAEALNQAPAMATGVSDATIAGTPSLRARREAEEAAAASAPAATAPPTAARRRGLMVPIAAGIVIVALAAEIRWLATHRNQPPAAGPTAPLASTPDSVATQSAAAAPPTGAKPSPSVVKQVVAPTPTSANAATAIAAPTAPVANPVVSRRVRRFQSQDARPEAEYARLSRVSDVGKLPAAFAFQVQMDGKLYFKGTARQAEAGTSDALYAPPGVHELRIVVGSGAGAEATSKNIVSADFVAKKRMSLKVELAAGCCRVRPKPWTLRRRWWRRSNRIGCFSRLLVRCNRFCHNRCVAWRKTSRATQGILMG